MVFEMKNIVKNYGSLCANDHVSIHLNKGEILAIIGENGAGKSTITKILYGLEKPDEGEIFVDGKQVRFRSPTDAMAVGIGMVQQHFMLFESMSIAENIVFKNEITKGPFLDRKKTIKTVTALSKQYGLEIDPEAKIEDCSVGIRQRVEILKILYQNANIIIFDEPSAVLTPLEVEALLETMKQLAKMGKSIVLITHGRRVRGLRFQIPLHRSNDLYRRLCLVGNGCSAACQFQSVWHDVRSDYAGGAVQRRKRYAAQHGGAGRSGQRHRGDYYASHVCQAFERAAGSLQKEESRRRKFTAERWDVRGGNGVMNVSLEYLLSVLNSTVRYMTPILLVTLCAGICSKVNVFNIALEGTLLAAAFFGFLAQYYFRNIFLSVLIAMLVGMLITLLMAFFVVKLKGHPMIVGMAINTIATGLTTLLLSVIFHTKGLISEPGMEGLTKVVLPGVQNSPVLESIFSSLTVVDYLAFLMAFAVFVFLYKTKTGFRLRAIGINEEAAGSLGIHVQKYQIIACTISGSMIGLAGCLLSLGSVTLFVQKISAARGYIALAADSLCMSHPLGAIASSALFGFTTALSYVLQKTPVRQQLLNCIPWIATIVAVAVYNVDALRKKNKPKKKTPKK
jgi:general nucleoside transport system permease protein